MAVDDPPAAPAGTPPAGPGSHFLARRNRPRRWPRRMLVTCNVLSVLLIAGACTVGTYAYYELNKIKRVHVKGLTAVGNGKQGVAANHTPAFTVLIIGADTRNLKKATGLNIGNAAVNSEDLSDSIILARIAPRTGEVALLSIPRDLFVNVPGLGQQKINAAFSGGDPSRLIWVIQHELGIAVNHFVEVNFDSFEQIADDIGGVEQYFPSPARDYESDLYVPKAGCVLLKGAQALAFVRSRNYYAYVDGQWVLQTEPESDLGRIQRQQAFIKNAIAKAEREGDLTNVGVLTGIIGSVTSNLTVDTGFSDSQLLSLAEDFAHIRVNAIPNLTYPTENVPVATGQVSPGLQRLPAADAATVAEFLSISKPKGAPKKRTTTSPTTSTTVPHGAISVAVENGSGAANQAGDAAATLRAAGYQVSGASDAAAFDHRRNEVEYGAAGLAAARTLQHDLAGGAALVADPALSGSDLIFVTGSAYAGLHRSSSVSASSTTTTTLPTYGSPYASASKILPYSSSSYHGVYIPPGRVPGQKVSTCGD